MPQIQNPSPRRKTRIYADVLSQLEAFCRTLPAGARLPTHRVLMRQLDASERATLRALEELHRSGRVIRRNGAGTFVAERTPSAMVHPGAVGSPCVVAVAEPEGLFFDRCVAELFRLAEAADISLVCRPVRSDVRSLPGDGSAAGYLVFGPRLAPLAKHLQQEGHRVVLVGEPADDALPEVPWVYSDPEQGAYLAACHLLELGHRRLAFCGEEEAHATPCRRGCLRALRESGAPEGHSQLSLLPAARIEAWSENPERAADYFRGVAAPTAILARDDRLAVRVLAALARAGVPVPRRVSVVGCDTSPEAERVFPALTTIDSGLRQQLREALRLLTLPVPPPPSHATVVVPALLRRESTSAPLVDG